MGNLCGVSENRPNLRLPQILYHEQPLSQSLKATQPKWKTFNFCENNINIDRYDALKVTPREIEHMLKDITTKLRIKDRKSVKKLGFDLSRLRFNTSLNAETLLFATNEFSSHFPYIKDLSLSFRSISLTTEDVLQKIGFIIGKKLVCLEKLTLDFRFSDIRDRDAERLTLSLNKSITRLKALKLDFSCCDKVNDAGLMEVIRIISKYQCNLNYLALGFGKHISDVGLVFLAEKAAKWLQKLQGLTLEFNSCKDISDYGIQSFSNIIGSNLTTLWQFSLDLWDCSNVTDEGLHFFITGISHLTKLKQLKFAFGNIRSISDKAFQALSLGIGRNLAQLEKLTLIFSWCFFITNQSLDILSIEISNNLKNLQQLTLDASGQFFNLLRDLTAYSCSKITPECLRAAHERCLFIPKLSIKPI